MGCDCAKTTTSLNNEGEEAVQIYEKALGYSHFPMEIVLKAFQQAGESRGGLRGKELKECLEGLGVPSSGLDVDKSPLSVFYQHFRGEDGLFSLQSLTLLTILLAEGSLKRKSETIFALYGLEATQLISEASVTEVIQEICDISVLYLPMYAEMETFALDDHGNRKVKQYNMRLAQGYLSLFHGLQAEIIRNRREMTYEEFVDTVVTKAEYLFDPKELRNRAITVGNSVPHLGEERPKGRNGGNKPVGR
jgi:hypothetical protein